MKVFRKIFWIVGIILYVLPSVLNLFTRSYFILLPIIFFIIYIGLFIIYFFAEHKDHFRQVTLIISVVSIFLYPIFYIPSYHMGITIKFRNYETELDKFVMKIKDNKDLESTDIKVLEFSKSSIGITSFNKEKDAVFLTFDNGLPALVYYFDPKITNTIKSNKGFTIKLTDNWFAQDF